MYGLEIGDKCVTLCDVKDYDTIIPKGTVFEITGFAAYLTYKYRKMFKDRGLKPKSYFIVGKTDNNTIRIDFFNLKKLK